MAKTLTLQDLADFIRTEQEGKKDLIVDTRNLRLSHEYTPDGFPQLDVYEQGDDLKHLTDVFTPNDHFHAQLASTLGIPKRYYDRMRWEQPELLTYNVNHWFMAEPGTHMLRTVHGTARAFLSDRYRRLDNIDLIEQLFPIFAGIPTLKFHQAAITDQRMYLRVLDERLTGEVKKGDTVQAGIEISNSEVGSGALQIKSFILRLVCLNGMTTEVVLRKTHLGRRIDDIDSYRDETVEADDKAFFLKVRDDVENALTTARFEQLMSQMQGAAQTEPLQNVIEATKVLSQRHSLTEGESNSILTHLITGADLSLWGLVNAVTDAADEADDFARQAELEALGGQLLEMQHADWQKLVAA